jgi:hypothetical protein
MDLLRLALWEVALTSRVMVQGQLTEESVGGRREDGEWRRQVMAEAAKMGYGWGAKRTMLRVEELSAGVGKPGGNRDVWLHLCSGEGKGLREAAREVGATVVAVDVERMEETQGETRVQMDLAEMSWELWVELACAKAAVHRDRLAGIIAGVPCTTYSHADASNKRRGRSWNYRKVESERKEPQHLSGTAKGDLARAHDWISEGAITVMEASRLPWLLENPEALLRCRPHMARAGKWLRTVHYCAYWSNQEAGEGNPCKKATNLWTNVTRWRQKGTTGTGKCKQGKCKWGWWRGGKWVHHPLQGGKASIKQRTPRGLLREWLSAAREHGKGRAAN